MAIGFFYCFDLYYEMKMYRPTYIKVHVMVRMIGVGEMCFIHLLLTFINSQ